MSNESVSQGISAQAPSVEVRNESSRVTLEQRNKDKKHLDTLSLIYLIFAAINGFSVLMLTLGSIIVGVIIAVVSNDLNGTPKWGAILTIVGGVVFGVVGGLGVYLLSLTSRSLAARKRPTLCFVVGCLMCFNPPLGTLLGIFTIIVLRRESVKELFYRGEAL